MAKRPQKIIFATFPVDGARYLMLGIKQRNAEHVFKQLQQLDQIQNKIAANSERLDQFETDRATGKMGEIEYQTALTQLNQQTHEILQQYYDGASELIIANKQVFNSASTFNIHPLTEDAFNADRFEFRSIK